MSGQEMSGPGFLDRWSRRKQAARRKAEATAKATAPPGNAAAMAEQQVEAKASAPPATGKTAEDEAISEEELARLPPIEEATRSADLRPYLRRGVPEALRRQAMRRIWMLNPAIRDYVDPALDYAWDFNAPQKGPTVAKGVASLVGSILGSARERESDGPPAPKRDLARGQDEAKPSAAEQAPRPDAPPQGHEEAMNAASRAEAPPAAGGEEGAAPRPRRRHGGAAPRLA